MTNMLPCLCIITSTTENSSTYAQKCTKIPVSSLQKYRLIPVQFYHTWDNASFFLEFQAVAMFEVHIVSRVAGQIIKQDKLLKWEDKEGDVSSYWITLREWGYQKLKEEALDRILWGTRCGKDYGPVVRQTSEWMNKWMSERMNEWMKSRNCLRKIPLLEL